MIIITIIIIMIIITIIIIISRIVLNAYVLNIPPQTPLKSTKMQHRWTDRRTDIQFHETLKDLDPKDTYTSNFWNPHSHGHAVESIRKCIKISENHTRFEGFNLKNWLQNAKNAQVTWSAIMPIFNEVWRCYSHQRSWPEWHICQISLESNQNKSRYRPDTKHSWASTQVH